MDISPRNGSKRSSEPIDELLRSEGYFRKNAPHDATCLFRAVSEQVYLTQYYHLKVRQECVEFMRKNKELFEENVKIPFDNYLEQLSCVTEWGGNVEIQAMSQLYRRDFVVFHAQKLDCFEATNHGFEKTIRLCQLTAKVYESVLKREIISPAAFCQSLVYQTLYKKVFGMSEIDDTVQKMLHDRATNVRYDRFSLRNNVNHQFSADPPKIESDSTDASKSTYSKAPFPYRVAKALDPNIYRNIDFDIWQEIRKEVRRAGWTCWNDSKLQIGAKCLVQLDKENMDDTNNNSQLSNLTNLSNSLAKVPALLIGHIQEMSKNEGPVLVFIEELGEYRRVPYYALKPWLATRKPQLPLGVVSPRKNWRNKWNNPNKSKDSITNMMNNIDSMNNNDYEREKKCGSNECSEGQVSNEAKILKKFTGFENYSLSNSSSNSNCHSNSNFGNAFEVRPVSIVLDNQNLITEVKDEHVKPQSPSGNNNNAMVNNNNVEGYEKSGSSGQDGNAGNNAQMGLMQPTHQPSPVPQPQESYYTQSVGPMYAPNTNVMCVSSEGAMYPVQYFSGGQSEAQTPLAGPDRGIRPINIAAQFSTDINGNDLPYSDPATLRFFYNLGVEAFRYGQMWQPGGPLAYGPPYLPPGNVMPIASPAVPAEAPQALQTPPRNDEHSGQSAGGQNQQRRRIEAGNSGRNSGMSGDSRGGRSYTRKGDNDGNFPRNETPSPAYDYQKNRGYSNNEEKDNREQRKNSQARYKKNNEGFSNSAFSARSRNFDRAPQFQPDFQKPRENPPSSTFRAENSSFHRVRNESNHLQSPQPMNQQSPAPSAPSNQFQPYGHPPVYNSIQYYSGESENYYPPNPNFYPVPIIPPPETEAGNVGPYVCAGPENYPPSMSPMYPPYVFPPPALYQGVPPANHQDNWYPVPNQSQYVPYQGQVTQPNINRPPTTS